MTPTVAFVWPHSFGRSARQSTLFREVRHDAALAGPEQPLRRISVMSH